MSKLYVLNAYIVFSPEKMQLAARDNDQLVIKLNKPVSRCLELLIERRFSLVSHDAFYPYVWGDEGHSVSVNMLYQCITLLRKALKTFKPVGEKMIHTVPKQGFSLHPDVIVEEITDEDITPPPSHSLPISLPITGQENDADVNRPLLPIKTRFSARWREMSLLFFCIVLMGGVFFQLIHWGYPSSIGYLSAYTKKTVVSGCQVFTDHVVRNVDKLKENIHRSQIDCTKTPYLYLTGFQYSHQVSFLFCEQPLSGSTISTCSVSYIKGV